MEQVPRWARSQRGRTLHHPNIDSEYCLPAVDDNDDAYNFVICADPQFGMRDQNLSTQYEADYSRRAVQYLNQLRPRPLFCCVCGDLTDMTAELFTNVPKPNNDDSHWTRAECDEIQDAQNEEFQSIWSQLHPEIALVCLCGNHDVGNRPTPHSIQRFTSRYGDDYLGFWTKSVYNLVINSNLFNDPSGAPEEYERQLAFLRDRLAAAAQQSASLIFVYSHHPWFLYHPDETPETTTGTSPLPDFWGSGSIPDYYFHVPRERRRTVLQLFEQYRVRAAFAGHFHQNRLASTPWGMSMIVTSSLSVTLQSTANPTDTPPTAGVRIVRVRPARQSFTHEFVSL